MHTTAQSAVSFALAVSFIPLSLGGPSDILDRASIRADIRAEIRAEATARGPAAEGELLVKYKGEKGFRVERLEGGVSAEAAAKDLRSRHDVEYAEPNYLVEAYMTPNDPYFSYQWNFPKIGMPAAWDVSSGGGATVAVLDTGVAYEDFTQGTRKYFRAPDLAGTTFTAGYDFVNNDSHPNDDNGHGTHVAGTVAGSTNNAAGVAGIAYSASIMPVKVLSSNGSGTHAALASGIKYAADNGAKVINLSLGGPSSQTLEDAVKYAFDKGVTIIAASGNDGTGTVSYPAAYDQYVIAVGATRYDNTKAWYSNWGSALDIVAPGGDLQVDQNGDGYGDGILQQTFSGNNYGTFGYYFFQGTSMATPHVAGVAALVIAHGSAVSPADVRAALESTADDLGTAGRDNTYGYGLLDPVGALAWAGAGDPPPPPPQDDPPIVPPQEVSVFSDSFEVSEWNGLWTEDIQNDWYRSSQRAKSGTSAAEVDGNANNAQLVSVPVALQGKTNARITFSWYIESSLDSGEYVAFDTSTDGGVSWTERARVRGNIDQENIWHDASITLNGISNLKLRFRGKMSDSSEDANADNVQVVAW